jgi:hypothetical protein
LSSSKVVWCGRIQAQMQRKVAVMSAQLRVQQPTDSLTTLGIHMRAAAAATVAAADSTGAS